MRDIAQEDEFAIMLEIDNKKLSNLCCNYYCIWLLKQTWCYATCPSMVKQKCLELCYDLVHSGSRYYSGIDYLWINHDWTISTWLKTYHNDYFKHSKFCIKNA